MRVALWFLVGTKQWRVQGGIGGVSIADYDTAEEAITMAVLQFREAYTMPQYTVTGYTASKGGKYETPAIALCDGANQWPGVVVHGVVVHLTTNDKQKAIETFIAFARLV